MIDVYQAATQMTDESGQTFPLHANALLDNAINLGYYGAFTANMHTDFNPSNSQTWSTAIINAAKARNVPVITAKQMLDWLDGRNASAFQSLVVERQRAVVQHRGRRERERAVCAAAVGRAVGRPRRGSLYNGSPLTFTTQTIKGVSYAVFPAGAGSYQASYGGDITPPVDFRGVGRRRARRRRPSRGRPTSRRPRRSTTAPAPARSARASATRCW